MIANVFLRAAHLVVCAGVVLLAAPGSAGADGLQVTGIAHVHPPSGVPPVGPPEFALGEEIVIQMSGIGTDAFDPSLWQLYFDGRAVTPAKAGRLSDDRKGLIFRLRRPDGTGTDPIRESWNALLGSPNAGTREVTVSIGLTDRKDAPRLTTKDNVIRLTLLETWRLVWATIAAIAGIGGAVILARTTGVLRDNLLPQVPPLRQPYSLGRIQMAWWFVLVLVSFLFMWVYLNDYNTINPQALILMGISTATGLGAIAANSTNNSVLTAADDALKAAGFITPADIAALDAQLLANPADATLLARRALYDKHTTGYVSQNLSADILNDENGAALHRLQVAGWTIVLGAIFLIGVYLSLAMPEFSNTLLALMAVSGGSYVGFKIAEKT